MVSKTLVTFGYVLVFWGALPGLLAALAALEERLLGPHLRLQGLRWAGLGLAVAAGAILAASILQYFRASGSLPISAFPPRKLIRTGLFGVWRHPIYLFSVLFFSGLGITVWPAGFLLASFPVLAAGTVIYASFEETGLEKRFGRAYEGHCRQTSIILPGLRQLLRPVAAGLCRFYFRYEVSGRENGKIEPPFFVVSAHRNYLDSVFISLALGVPVHFITTSERFRSPLSRAFYSRLCALSKKRYTPDVRHALEIRRRLAEGCAVGLFPEAERSWTGEMCEFKAGALKLLRAHPEIPILPLRLQGAYEAWPRWAPLPRRTKVVAQVGELVFASAGESWPAFEARIRALIEPPRASRSLSTPVSAKGIGTLVYRCPECRSFDSVRSGRGEAFFCARCGARFELRPDRSVRRIGRDGSIPLADLTKRIFTGSAAMVPDGSPGRRSTADGTSLAIDRDGRMKTRGTGRLELTDAGLSFDGPDGLVRFDLAATRAVVVEGARILQMYGGRPPVLFQLTLKDQSVLKWQHLIAAEVRRARGSGPDMA